MVADVIGVVDEVAVPGLSLDTDGELLVPFAGICGAPVKYVSISATRSDDFRT